MAALRNDSRVLIVGAGLAGLTAARHLAAAGRSVTIVDKGRSVGGRLATRRMGRGTFDHGAQFFTTRSDSFAEAVDRWRAAGVVEEWCRGFGQPDGYPRFRVAGGMNQLAKHLAAELPDLVTVLTSTPAASLIPLGHTAALTYEPHALREPDEAADLIITAPVPQALALLDGGAFRMAPDIGDAIRDIRYHQVLALLATLSAAPDWGEAGAIQRPDDPVFSFAADNGTKGVSAVPAATFHVAHGLSAELFAEPDHVVLDRLRPTAEAWLGPARIQQAQVKRWRHAGPVTPWPDRCAVVSPTGEARVVLAGDAFGGPKVEGAFLSGQAAALVVLGETDT